MWTDLRDYLANQRVLVWGLGREGRSTLEFFRRHLPDQKLILTDAQEPGSWRATGPDVEFWPETKARDSFDRFDLILKSPGISLRSQSLSPVTLSRIRGQADLFLQFAPGMVIGVTGTKGKSTTSSLLAHLLSASGPSVPLVGNIGVPAWEILETLTPASPVVIELSSYQLERSQHSPTLSLLLNLYEEHLNYHGSVEAYWDAKWNVCRWQKPGQKFFYNGRCAAVLQNLSHVPREVERIDFSDPRSQPEGLLTAPALRGEHNRLNILAAASVAASLGCAPSQIASQLRSFQGLPHRLEQIGTFGTVTYYNDSISTVPESALAALAALPETSTMILGGQNRGVAYEHLAAVLEESSLLSIILISETGRILQALLQSDPRVFWVEDLAQAVQLARRLTPPGGCCLFSPAAPSYNQFRNFEERGLRFRELVSG